ncbi:hypothetical protein Pta02_32880 [Planobispora takensis]|uniref:Uncharacterized protein n=1 Tax=Planobispora takensis TaxID=1367882 RepID=A0A8J3SXS0_9ACTN|nr:hypothetical protein Pta02_32880 [Planobispora takensis]
MTSATGRASLPPPGDIRAAEPASLPHEAPMGATRPKRWPGMTSHHRDCYRRVRDMQSRGVSAWARSPRPPCDRITHLLDLPQAPPSGGAAAEDVLTHHDEGKAE